MGSTGFYPFEGGHEEIPLEGTVPNPVDVSGDISVPEDVVAAGVPARAFLTNTILPATHEFSHPMEEAGVMPR